MLARLRLDQTGHYEKLVGAYEISKMLHSFVLGSLHPTEIGAEQGTIEKWDDFVLLKEENNKTHIQIKRQTGRFGSHLDECKRNFKTKNDKQLRELSELDKTIKSLGDWIREKKSSDDFIRKFILILYDGGVEIKKGFKVRNLTNIIQSHIKENVTTVSGLKDLNDNDASMENCVNWLMTWCGIRSYDEILDLLILLSVDITNTETQLKEDMKNLLKVIFKDLHLDDIVTKIISYTSENSTFTGAIKPRHLLYILKDFLRPEVNRWTQFDKKDAYWNISGIHDLEENSEIERPSVIVPAFWTSNDKKILKINGLCSDSCKFSHSLARLFLHPLVSFDFMCSHKNEWIDFYNKEIGGTLGISSDDSRHLNIIGSVDSFIFGEKVSLDSFTKAESFASRLQSEMYKVTFTLLDKEVFNDIMNMTAGNLRDDIEKRWNNWRNSLQSDTELQKKLFSKMLQPKAESLLNSGELRVGPKTIILLKDALFLLLIVSVCLSDDDHNDNWETITTKLNMTSIGLTYWSGPSSGVRKTIRIDDDNGLSKLLEEEDGHIIILPQSELSEKEAFDDDIFSNMDKVGLLTHPNYPKLLITKDRYFKKLLSNCNKEELRNYFQNKLDKYQVGIDHAIKNVINEVGVV